MKIDFYTSTGEKKGAWSLAKEIFETEINKDLMHRAVIRKLSNARLNIAHTKTRAEVEMTKKKAFRQKGTGNARRGAKSTNLLRGGGVTHGPRNNRNFTLDMPKKERRKALFSSLSWQAKDDNVFGLESFDSPKPQTKTFAEMLAKLPQGKKYLFVLPEKDIIFEKSVSNIPHTKTILASYLNPYDVLNNEKICFVKKESLDLLEKTFLTPSS